jgi:hypothetical protein
MVGCAPKRELNTESLGGLQNLLNENQYASLPALRSLPSISEYPDRDIETKTSDFDDLSTHVESDTTALTRTLRSQNYEKQEGSTRLSLSIEEGKDKL